ncbi:acetoacetate decarboxylase family protein [Pseudomonas aeruginosa]|uniref:acetoacetate decarboxylase family protein n=1 Tax=Pseudomonas aeruginosa TaxID=287 RepID=UPI001DC452A9|nr:acetoacetate decarboxylase family protein [Gammaproteobacteria bacterium]MBU0883240.1 acetoacetate decarboxylase family protein [Gammaproteobacteria bacterium]MBU1861790.1 acetoacetate decarboxylase family protein [Gammaproteobacteria bacterium]
MTAWRQDPFFQYPLTSFQSSEGNVDLPILYFDNSNFMSMFEVEYEAANAFLKDKGLTAVRFAGGKALVVVGFYEYRETAIADYNEVGVAIACVPSGVKAPCLPLLSLYQPLDKQQVGFHVIDLPVTTQAACVAGREVWGYPKFVTPIGFSLDAKRFKGTVSDPESGDSMLELSGNLGMGLPAPQLDLVLFSHHEGALLRTLVNTRGGGRACLPGSLRLKVINSEHPMTRRLAQLGLSNAAPKMVFHSHGLQLRLNAGASIA